MRILKWLCKNESPDWPRPTPDAIRAIAKGAACQGQIAVLEWLYDECSYIGDAAVARIAVTNGQLAVRQWFNDHEGSALLADVVDCAATYRQLAILQWLHDHTSDGWTTNAMDHAASDGHLEVVKWLHADRTEGCSPAALTRAAGANHLEVVIWLLEHQDLQWPKGTLSMCSADTIQWIIANNKLDVTAASEQPAATQGYLHQLQDLCTLDPQRVRPSVATNAASWGHLGVLEWLYSHFPDQLGIEWVRERAAYHPQILSWFDSLPDTELTSE